MGNKHTADGRWIVGNGNSGDDYKGFLHWRECYICLTESGATEESVNYLNALKDYALAHYALGEPIMPPSMTVWVVANGKATAVQADDVKVEDGDYTICGITYSDGAWDYSNAGQGQGGGSFLPAVTAEDNGDVLTVVDGAWGKGDAPYTVGESMSTIFAEQTVTTASYQGTNVAQLPGSVDISVGTPCEVTYNGTAYDVTAQEMSGNVYLGEFSGQDPDFTNYPFFIVVIKNSGMTLYSSAANPTLKIDAITKTIVPSETFEEAVKISLNNPVFPHIVQVEWVVGQNIFVSRESFDDVLAILDEIEVPVQMQFLYGRFNGLLISLEEKRGSSLISIQGHFVLDELREVGTIYTNTPTLYTMIWTSADGITIDTQELSIPST